MGCSGQRFGGFIQLQGSATAAEHRLTPWWGQPALASEEVQFPANEKLGKRRMQDFAGPAVDKIFTKRAMKVTKKP